MGMITAPLSLLAGNGGHNPLLVGLCYCVQRKSHAGGHEAGVGRCARCTGAGYRRITFGFANSGSSAAYNFCTACVSVAGSLASRQRRNGGLSMCPAPVPRAASAVGGRPIARRAADVPGFDTRGCGLVWPLPEPPGRSVMRLWTPPCGGRIRRAGWKVVRRHANVDPGVGWSATGISLRGGSQFAPLPPGESRA